MITLLRVSKANEAYISSHIWGRAISFGRRRFGAKQLGAVLFRRRTFGRRFLIYFSSYEEKNNEAGNSLNAIECEPVPTRVLNPNAKKQRRTYCSLKVINE